MKRFSLILLSLLLIEACAGYFAEEAPWVTMENVREHSGYVWREEIPHYNRAEEQGFQPLAMDPAEAWQRLRDAYDRGQDEATCELLQSWGIEMEPCGAPVLRELISQADLQHQGHSDVSTENGLKSIEYSTLSKRLGRLNYLIVKCMACSNDNTPWRAGGGLWRRRSSFGRKRCR